MKSVAFLSIVAVVLSSCVTPVKQTVAFDESALQWSTAVGNAAIVGSAFLKTRGGDVKVGAGDKVELIPATPYTKERFQLALKVGMYRPVEARDPRLAKYVRTTIADAQGNFEFKNIPSGEYILACNIQWQYATEFGAATTGGQVVSFVSVVGDEMRKVVLTQ